MEVKVKVKDVKYDYYLGIEAIECLKEQHHDQLTFEYRKVKFEVKVRVEVNVRWTSRSGCQV